MRGPHWPRKVFRTSPSQTGTRRESTRRPWEGVLSFHLNACERKVSPHYALNSLTSLPRRDFFVVVAVLLLWLKIHCWSASVAPEPWRQSSESQEQVWVNDTPLIHRPCPISSCKVARVSHSVILFNTMREEGPWHKRSALFNDFVRLAFN